jgi:hypothetical protein
LSCPVRRCSFPVRLRLMVDSARAARLRVGLLLATLRSLKR